MLRRFSTMSMVLLFVLMSTNLFAGKINDDFSLSTTMRYRYWVNDGMMNGTGNEFTFDRAYITMKYKLADDIKARFTVDFTHKNRYDTGYYPDGTSYKKLINEGTRSRIKYAYLEFKNFLGVDNVDMIFGNYEQPGPQSYHGTIENSWLDRYTYDNAVAFPEGFSSAVTGLMATYNLPNKLGYTRLALSNKNTYSYAGDDNKAKNIGVDLWLHPVEGFTVFGWGIMDYMYSGNNEEHNDAFGGGIEYAVADKFDAGVEVDFGRSTIKNAAGDTPSGISYMGYVNYDLNPNLMLLAQAGIHDGNSDVDDDEITMILGGVNYKIVGSCMLMFNAKAENYKPAPGADSEMDMTYVTQLLIEF